MVRVYPRGVARLGDELERIARLASAHAAPGEPVSAVLAAEPAGGRRLYLCAFGDTADSWLVLDEAGEPVEERTTVREAASIAALCEVAVETAGGGDVEALRSQLVALRLSEAPEGIEEAEEAALELERALGAPPRVASPGWLDAVGIATLRLERALGQAAGSPFAEAMKAAVGIVESLAGDVERGYRLPLR
jgi:hypothetical protein